MRERVALRQGAIGPLRIALGGDIESPVEASPKVLPGDDPCQLDELLFGELLSQSGDLLVCRSRGCCREGDCVVQD